MKGITNVASYVKYEYMGSKEIRYFVNMKLETSWINRVIDSSINM